MKKLLLFLILTKINLDNVNAQFYKDSSAYAIGFYAGPLITYGHSPQGGNNNLYPQVSFTGGVAVGFRLSNEALFSTGLGYVSNTFSIKHYEDNSFSSLGLKAIHVIDEYHFSSLQIPVGIKAAVLKKRHWYLTLEALAAINLTTSGGHTIKYYNNLLADEEIKYGVGGDESSRTGQSIYFNVALNYPFKKSTIAIEPFWSASRLKFNYEGGVSSYTYHFNLTSIGIRIKAIVK